RTTRVYVFQQPVIGTDGQPLAVTDADWTACDRRADYYAQATVGLEGGLAVGAFRASGEIAGAIALPTSAAPVGSEPPNVRARAQRAYEEQMRVCLKRRGYAVTAPNWDPARAKP